MPRRRDRNDAPRMDTDDSLTTREGQRTSNVRHRPGDLDSRVRATIARMSAQGPDAEWEYQAALRALAGEPDVAAVVASFYRATPEDQYIERWSHVHLLSDLRDRSALAVLEAIVSAPIPAEKAPDMVTYSTVGEEVMIRTTAIEGITRLAVEGDREALELLLRFAQHETFSVRRAAIQGYVEAAGPNARDELRDRLAEEDRFILDIRRADVQDVPQPSVGQTVDDGDRVPPLPPSQGALRPRIEE